jgi:hypothetical protein
MKAKARPKRADELTPRHRSMRKKPLARSSRPAVSKKIVSRDVKTTRRPSRSASGFDGPHILGAVIGLLALLLIGAVIVIVLEKPQAAEAWKLIGTIFPPTIASLLAFLAGRSTKRT